MTIRNRLAIALMIFLVPMAFASTAQSGAGDACAGTQCGLGGQIRGQIGDGLPLPISIAPARTGPFSAITMHTTDPFGGLPLVGNGLGQFGQIKPTTNAFINQTTAAPHAAKTGNPRALTVAPGLFHYGEAEGSIGVVAFNNAVFAVQTNLIYDQPHPGTDGNGNPVTPPGATGPGDLSRVLSAGGRPGLATVTYCAGAPGSPGNNFNGFCTDPGKGVGVNGLARFTKTSNQFGGVSTGRTLGTAKVYFNKDGLALINLPCTGCQFQLSTVIPGTTGVAGGPFGGTVMNPAFQTATGVYTGTIGFNGTIIGFGNIVTPGGGTTTVTGNGIYFTGQAASSVGFPLTTGKLTVSVTEVLPGEPVEIWKRGGTDARTAGGNGVVALNTGAMSARSISKGNANRTWITYEIPEPSAILAASAGLLALFGCNQLVRRRSR